MSRVDDRAAKLLPFGDYGSHPSLSSRGRQATHDLIRLTNVTSARGANRVPEDAQLTVHAGQRFRHSLAP